jgi:GAF domain-containing protein
MARTLTYKELEKSNNSNEKELLQLKQYMDLLQTSLTGTERHLHTHEAIVECVDLLLRQKKFIDIAHDIYSKCKDILGATTGYVALVDQSGKCLDVLHLDTGGLLCTVNYESPMPIRGLRKEALQKKTSLYCNKFDRSKWMRYLPKGHVQLQNVLFAPIVIEETPAGLLGFANKPKGFDQDDIRIASSFAKLAALALSHSKAWHVMKKKPGWH